MMKYIWLTYLLLLALVAESLALATFDASAASSQHKEVRETGSSMEGQWAEEGRQLIPLPAFNYTLIPIYGVWAAVLALYITFIVTWFTNTPTLSKRSDTNQNYGYGYGYNNYDNHYHYEGYRNPGYGDRVSRVLDYISPDSFQRLVSSLRPAIEQINLRPSIARMGSGAVESVGGLVSDTLVQGAKVLTQMTDSLSGGVERMSGMVADKNVTDCFLQTVCYLSAPENNFLDSMLSKRMLEVTNFDEAFEGRKKKDRSEKKQAKKDKKRKQELEEEESNKKKDKKKKNSSKKKKDEEAKQKEEEEDDDEDYYYEDEDEVSTSTTEASKSNSTSKAEANKKGSKDEPLKPNDCEVFNCPAVRLGHNMVSLYRKFNQIRSRNAEASNSIVHS